MPENTGIQSKHFIVKLKKTFHIITALAFFLQQLVPYSSAFAMSDDEEADFSNPAVSPFNPTSGVTKHRVFMGQLHKKAYEIWEELSKRETEHLRPLTAKKVPVVADSEKIVFTLGRGNFGATYVGRNLETREIFAIKEVHGQTYVDESLQEGRVVHFLGDHLHIMPLIDYLHHKPYDITEAPSLFQVMPLAYINGDGFKEMLARSQNTQREKIVADSFYQMMMGLEYIHRKGVVHLDIKADNTLYMQNGTLRIADFGRAKILGANDQITDPDSGLGAKKKFSPEIIALFRKYKGWTTNIVHSFSGKGADVWAAGLYIWELLEDNTDHLFSMKPITQSEMQWASNYNYAYFKDALEKIDELNGKYSEPLLTLLRQVLTVDPETRIKSPQIIENLSSSAMKPDDRRVAFEELIQVYKNPGSVGGGQPLVDQQRSLVPMPKPDNQLLPEVLILADSYPDSSVLVNDNTVQINPFFNVAEPKPTSIPVPNLSTPNLIETPPLRIRRPAQEIPPEVAAPLSASSVAVHPQAVEESGISFSGFTSFPTLDEGLDELSQLIIRATDAEKDLPFETRLVLEKALKESPSHADQLNRLVPRLLPPEELLFSLEEHHPLVSSANLTPEHPDFKPLSLLIAEMRDLTSPLQKEKLSPPVFSALGALQAYYADFIPRFCKSTSEERRQMLATRARMRGERIGAYLIPQETARALLSKDMYGVSSRHNNNQEGGQNAVYAKGGVHFKAGESSITDIDPAMEWVIHAFTSLFAGIGLPYPRTSASGFLFLENVLVKDCVDSEEAKGAKAEFNSQVVYPRGSSEEFFDKYPQYKKYFTRTKAIEGSVQASRTSGEMSLGDFLKDLEAGKATLLDLNLEAFEDLALVSLITVPSDAKDDNIRAFRDQKARVPIKMVSIDNDRAFADMIVVDEKGRHSIEGKNVLFLMKDLMEKSFSSSTVQKILTLNPVVFMLDWIKALQDQEKRIQDNILLQGKQSTYFPLKYTKGLFWTLLTRLETIQAEFKDRKILTPHSLLNKLFPIAAAYYKVLREPHPIKAAHPTDLHYAQQLLYGGRGLPDASVETLLAGQLERDPDLRSALARETALSGDSTNNRTQSLDQELMDFMDQLSTRMEGHDAPGNNTLGNNSLGNNSLLHHFAQTINKPYTGDFITFLLKKGIPLESENDAYETPLDLAMAYQNGPAFFALVNAGAGKRLQKAQTAETFYNRVIYTPEAAQYHQAFETLRTRSALIDGMFIRQHFFQNSTQSPIELAEYGPQALSQEAWNQLFDSNGVLKPIDPDATRKVGLIDLKGRGLFFKQYPALPGIETAVDVLTLLLFYRGVPYTALANIKGIPYLISKGIGREEQAAPPPPAPANANASSSSSLFSRLFDSQPAAPHPSFAHYKTNNLAYVLKYTPERLKDVDEESLSEAILMAMLTGQEDGQPKNFMLEPIPEKPGKFRIVPFDNDQAFVPEVSYPSPNSRQKGKLSRVQVKSVLFCFDQITGPIHPSVVEVLVHLNPEKLLRRWLEKLSRLTQEHEALFTEPSQLYNFWKNHETYIGIPFQRGDIQDVYFKLMKVKDLLKLNPYLTHLELLKEVLPFVHHRYNKIFNRDKTLPVQSIEKRFIDVDGESYGLAKGSNEHMTLTSSNNIFEAKNIKVRKNRNEAIVDSEELPPSQWQLELTKAKKAYEKEAVQLLIRKGGAKFAAILNGQPFKRLTLNLSRRSAYEQFLLFEALQIEQLEKLSLTHSSELKDSFFDRSFPALRELDIRGCLQLTNGVLALLMKSCPHLRSLNLAKNTALTKVAIINLIARDEPLTFNNLEILNISECSTLQQVRLHAPKLQHYFASECPQLSEIQLTGSPSLKTLDLRNAQSLPLSIFNALIQGNQATLAQVQTEGARNLPTIPKMPFQDIKTPIEGDNLRKFNDHHKKATENNDPEAQYQLAEMYASAQGVKQNLEIAFEWYRKAFEWYKETAEKGPVSAQYQLAEMYAKGQGVEQNLEIALEGYRKAAERGHKAAQSLIETYTRFLKGRLIYKPNEKNDEGRIELRIADLPNPLEGEFDLSKCGDAGKYLSINTGYRKGKRPENASKVEIWFAPRFLIEKNLAGSASHFKDIMGSWDASTAPVGTFFTWGDWGDLEWYEYIINESYDKISDGKNLYVLGRVSEYDLQPAHLPGHAFFPSYRGKVWIKIFSSHF